MSAEFQWTEYGSFSTKLLCAKLSDICVEKIGVKTGPFGSQLHKEDYVEIGTPIITVEHLGDNRITHIDTPFVSDEDKARLSKYHLTEGDIVFSRVGSVDRRALVRKEEDGWLFSGRCLRVRVDKTKIDPVYLSYFFGLEGFKNYIRNIAVGATMPSINTKILSDVPIYYPESLEKQREIANIFYAADNKIEHNRQTNQTLEHIAQAIFKSWFVDFEPTRAKIAAKQIAQAHQNGEPSAALKAALFADSRWSEAVAATIAEGDPERAAMAAISGKALDEIDPGQQEQLKATAALFPDALVETELGEVPVGWGVKQLDEIAENHSTTFNFSQIEEVVFVNTGDVLEGRFLHKNYSSKEGLPGQAKKTIKKDDILYSEIRPKNKRYAYVAEECDEYVVSTKFMIIRSLGFVQPRYLYQILRQQTTVDEFNVIAESRSGTFPQITFDSIGYMPIILPTEDVEEAFMSFFSPIIEQLDLIAKEEKSLADLRDALLPKLFSGELSTNPNLKEAARRLG